jgi:alanine racemase
MRPLSVSIDNQSLKNNLNIVKKFSPNSKIMAVLKANAYGHGLIECARNLNTIDGIAVLNLSEAIDLREHGFEHKILLLEGFFDKSEIGIASRMGIDSVVHCHEQIDMIHQAKPKKPLNIHLKFNTGMNRLGFPVHDSANLINSLIQNPLIDEITLMTHFANADEAAGISDQMNQFHHIPNEINLERSLANSAAIIKYPESHYEWVRPGIMLYGASPFSGINALEFKLQPVMSLTSEIIAIQDINAGESVGYGSSFIAKNKTRVGVVACGYADGYPRQANSKSPILVNDKKTHLLGRVSMDMLYVDITDISDAKIGSTVELWGKNISVDEVAECSGTVGYELLCAISASKRVPMRYVDGKK